MRQRRVGVQLRDAQRPVPGRGGEHVRAAGDGAAVVGAVEAQQVGPVLRALGHHAVRAAHDALLDGDALRREGVGRARVLQPHAAQRMEGHHQRHAEAGFQPQAHQAGHEEVGVHHVARDAVRQELPGRARKCRHVLQQLLLGDETRRPGRDVQHAHAGAQVHGGGQRGGVAAGEHVHVRAAPRQAARHVGDVGVLPARIHTALRGQGRGVLADQGDAQRRWRKAHETNPMAAMPFSAAIAIPLFRACGDCAVRGPKALDTGPARVCRGALRLLMQRAC